jgi:hypothetical protein
MNNEQLLLKFYHILNLLTNYPKSKPYIATSAICLVLSIVFISYSPLTDFSQSGFA